MLSKVPFLGLTEIITVLGNEVLDKGCDPCLKSGFFNRGQPYVVVPVGSNYTENLTTATILQDTGNGFGTNANGAKSFTMNGNGYILYKLAVNANTVSATWAFV